MLPYSEACERNKQPILDVLQNYFTDIRTVLEVGSGTAQHAVFFASHFPELEWQTSDLPQNLAVIQQRIAESGLGNLPDTLKLNVTDTDWPTAAVDAIFSANTLHIMSEESVPHFFRGSGQAVVDGGWLVVYGPFKYDGAFTSASNARFDLMLRESDPSMGIREFSELNQYAEQAGFSLSNDIAMPANNQCLIWRKV